MALDAFLGKRLHTDKLSAARLIDREEDWSDEVDDTKECVRFHLYLSDWGDEPEPTDEPAQIDKNDDDDEEWELRPNYNGYSVLVRVADGHITAIDRIGHNHMCGGQGTDSELGQFPYPSLEAEAQRELERILKESRKLARAKSAPTQEAHTPAQSAPRITPPLSPLEEIRQEIIAGESDCTRVATERALSQGVSAAVIWSEAVAPALRELQVAWRSGEYYFPELCYSMGALAVCREVCDSGAAWPRYGRVAIGTVAGDRHEMGVHSVMLALRGAGFDVVDVGKSVSVEGFVAALKEQPVDVLAISASTDAAVAVMRQVLSALDATALRASVKVLVGGPAVTRAVRDGLGADGWGYDMWEAVTEAKRLVAERNGRQAPEQVQ